MQKRVILIALFLTTLPSLASLGLKIDPTSIPNGICKITLKNSRTNEQFHCTGSVIGRQIIKTAGHCLHRSTVEKVQCLGADSITIESVQTYPSYDHRLLQREEENRYQDQALINVKEDLAAISFIPLMSSTSIDLNEFTQCLMAGFGRQESSMTKTGFLNGALIPNINSRIFLDDGVIRIAGAYLVELLPGDSGGPLLCYKKGQWFDLGTASAHTWEYESLYSANANLKAFNADFSVNPHNNGSPVNAFKTTSSAKRSFLRPYSTIKDSKNSVLYYNGDLTFVEVSNEFELNEDEIEAEIKVNSASQSFLCSSPFLCYGQNFRAIIKKVDLLDSPFRFPKPYDPFGS